MCNRLMAETKGIQFISDSTQNSSSKDDLGEEDSAKRQFSVLSVNVYLNLLKYGAYDHEVKMWALSVNNYESNRSSKKNENQGLLLIRLVPLPPCSSRSVPVTEAKHTALELSLLCEHEATLFSGILDSSTLDKHFEEAKFEGIDSEEQMNRIEQALNIAKYCSDTNEARKITYRLNIDKSVAFLRIPHKLSDDIDVYGQFMLNIVCKDIHPLVMELLYQTENSNIKQELEILNARKCAGWALKTNVSQVNSPVIAEQESSIEIQKGKQNQDHDFESARPVSVVSSTVKMGRSRNILGGRRTTSKRKRANPFHSF